MMSTEAKAANKFWELVHQTTHLNTHQELIHQTHSEISFLENLRN